MAFRAVMFSLYYLRDYPKIIEFLCHSPYDPYVHVEETARVILEFVSYGSDNVT